MWLEVFIKQNSSQIRELSHGKSSRMEWSSTSLQSLHCHLSTLSTKTVLKPQVYLYNSFV